MTEPSQTSRARERRRHRRVATNLLIQYRFDTFEAFVAEYVRDISEGGMLIRDPEVVRPIGTIVYVQFLLRDGTRLIEGLSRVVRVQEDPERTMAIAFVDFDDESKALIRSVVQRDPAEDVPTEDLLI